MVNLGVQYSFWISDQKSANPNNEALVFQAGLAGCSALHRRMPQMQILFDFDQLHKGLCTANTVHWNLEYSVNCQVSIANS